MPEGKTANPVLNGIQVLSTGLVLTTGLGLVNAYEGGVPDAEGILEGLFEVMSVEGLGEISIYFVLVLIGWAISGLAAGVRAKHPITGAFAALFGVLLAVALIVLLTLSADVVAEDDMTPFIFGVVASIFVCCLAAIASGRVTQPKKKERVKKRARGAWDRKSKWNCSRCGASLPPGALACPKCGIPVIE